MQLIGMIGQALVTLDPGEGVAASIVYQYLLDCIIWAAHARHREPMAWLPEAREIIAGMGDEEAVEARARADLHDYLMGR